MKTLNLKTLATFIITLGLITNLTSCSNEEGSAFNDFEASDLITNKTVKANDNSILFSISTKEYENIKDINNKVYVVAFKDNEFNNCYEANLISENKYKVTLSDTCNYDLKFVVNPSIKLLNEIQTNTETSEKLTKLVSEQVTNDTTEIKTSANLYLSEKKTTSTNLKSTTNPVEISLASAESINNEINGNVKDWNVVEIHYTFKKSTAIPSFIIKGKTVAEDKSNPTSITISNKENDIIVNATTKGVESSLSNINKLINCTIEETSKTVHDGNIYQTFIIHITDNASETNKIYNFRLSNGFYENINREFNINQE